MKRFLMAVAASAAASWCYAQQSAVDEVSAAVAAESGRPPAADADKPAEAKAVDSAEPAAAAPAAAPQAKEPAPAAVAAKKSFDDLVSKWAELIAAMKKVQADRAAVADAEGGKLDEQLAGLRHDADALIDDVTRAGLDVYAADPTAYPEVNTTLLRIAQHHLAGNAAGDGGDQYERALPLVRGLIDAGATERWPELWLWGGVAAYATNDFELAKKYFDSADEAGLLAAPPTSAPNDPRVRIWQNGAMFHRAINRAANAWSKEREIRDAEAKADDLPRVKLATTRGDIVLELFENEAPQAVANFLTLVKSGFYDGVVFHRVLPGFMAQGGDPQGTGSGGPGYSIRCECYLPNFRHHFRGSLSMAHAGRDTGGSQFFITFVPTSSLDGRHTAFGRVIEGMEAAAALQRRDPDGPPPLPTPDRILKAEVLRDRGHEYKFEKLPGR